MLRTVLPRYAGLVLSSLFLTALVGCGSESFAPPPPPELSQIPNARNTPPAVALELILAGSDGSWRAALEEATRLEAGKAKVLFTSARPATGDPPAKQADLIRAAAGRGINVLVVEPNETPEVAEALNEVRTRGVTVVLYWRSVPARDPGVPIPVVRYAAYARPAEELVGKVIQDAKDSKLAPDGPALVSVDSPAAPDAQEMVDAITSALKKHGVKDVKTVPVAGGPEAATKAFAKEVDADPKATIAIGLDESGTNAVLGEYQELRSHRGMAMGAIASLDRTLSASAKMDFAAIVDRNYSRLAKKAIELATSQQRGEKVDADTRVPLELLPRSRAGTALRASGVDPKSLAPTADAIPALPGAHGLPDKDPTIPVVKDAKKP